MIYQRLEPGSILGGVLIRLCSQASTLLILINQPTALLSRGVLMSVLIVLGCVSVLARPQCGPVKVVPGLGCSDLSVAGTLWTHVLWFPPAATKCIGTHFSPLAFIHTSAMKSHICACRSHGVMVNITGMLTCLGDNPWSHICAHLCVRSVCWCISVSSCIMLPLTDHKHNGPT